MPKSRRFRDNSPPSPPIPFVRPLPPDEIHGMFQPAPELLAWLQQTIFHEGHVLHNVDHEHLYHLVWPSLLVEPNLGFLWAGVPATRGEHRILGTCEKLQFKGAGWSRERQEAQMCEWFNDAVPDFLVTLDADFCRHCSDIDFCRLIEHELYHIQHAKDRNGMPAFGRDTGLPKLTLVSHDIEEFYKVAERYGADESIATLIDAANNRSVTDGAIASACGSTKLRIA